MDRCANFGVRPWILTPSIMSSGHSVSSQPPRDVVKVTQTHSGTELEIAVIACLSCWCVSALELKHFSVGLQRLERCC